MSWKAIGVFAALAALLGGAWFVLVRGGLSRPALRDSGPLFEFSPASVMRLELAFPADQADARDQPSRFVYERHPAAGWREVLAEIDGGETLAWPVNSGRVGVVLRQLAGLEVDAMRNAKPSGVIGFAVRLADGTEQRGGISQNAVAGRLTVVAEDGATGVAEPALLNALSNPEPMGWRELRVFPLSQRDGASRLRAVLGERAIALSRVQGRWALTEPLPAPVHPNAASRLLDAWSGLEVTALGVLDRTPAEPVPPGVEPVQRRDLGPVLASLSIEQDSIIGNGDRVTSLESSVQIRRYGDDAAVVLFGQTGASLLIAPPDVEALVPTADSLLARTAVQANPREVGALVVRSGARSRRFTHTLGRWVEAVEPSSGDEALAARTLVELLTSVEAAAELVPQAPPHGALGSIEVFDVSGLRLAELAIVGGKGRPIALASAAVVWTYDDGRSNPLIAWAVDAYEAPRVSDAPPQDGLPSK